MTVTVIRNPDFAVTKLPLPFKLSEPKIKRVCVSAWEPTAQNQDVIHATTSPQWLAG